MSTADDSRAVGWRVGVCVTGMLLGFAAGCQSPVAGTGSGGAGSGGAPSAGSGGAPSAQCPPADAGAMLDGRCGSTPRLLVNAGTYPVQPLGDSIGIGATPIGATSSDLFYEIVTFQTSGAGQLTGLTVVRVPFDGSAPMTVASTPGSGGSLLTPEALLVDMSPGPSETIFSYPLTGGAPSTLITSMDGLFYPLATDSTFLYVAQATSSGQIIIQAIALTGNPGPTVLTTSNKFGLNGGAISGSYLLVPEPQGTVERVPLPSSGGGPPTVLDTMLPAGPEAFTCGSRACVLAGKLFEIDPDGGPPKVLSSLGGVLADTSRVISDDTTFYGIGSPSSGSTVTIARIPTNGDEPVAIVNMPASDSGGLVADDTCLYWANACGIYSLRKDTTRPTLAGVVAEPGGRHPARAVSLR